MSLVVWFIPYRAPLWLDETVSYWAISGGLSHVWGRSIDSLSFPAYFYVLWLIRGLLGQSEVILRIPSVLAMLAAVVVLYRIARQFFDPDIACLTCILFCLHKDVAFAAIDVRPYAFAVLATNLAILALLTWLRAPNSRHSVLLGASCAAIFYFHYLYGVILPAFIACYFCVRGNAVRKDFAQILRVFASFAAALLPVIPRLLFILSRRNTYSFAAPPALSEFLFALAPPALPVAFLALLFVALLVRKMHLSIRDSYRPLLCFLSLAILPIAILFAVAVTTPMHVFVERYRLVAVIGISLFWGYFLGLVRSIPLRLVFCLFLVPLAIVAFWRSPDAHRHGYTWKPALDYAQFIAESDRAPLLICSDLPQADFEPMPAGAPAESVLFAPLSYYTVSVPVVPLPRALTPLARQIGSAALRQALRNQQRFLVLAFHPSYPTVQWLMDQSKGSFEIQFLAGFDGVIVVEFRPFPLATGH